LLTISSTGTGTSVFQWKRNSTNISGATNSTYSASTSGTYSCYQNIGGTCIATTPGVAVNVLAAPVPVITLSSGTLQTASTFVTYQWKKNGIVISGATTNTVTPTGNGVYTVIVTDANTCEGTSAAFTLSSVGVNNINEAATVTICPNPATRMVHIESPVAVKAIISCMDGKTALEYTNTKDMDISALPNGVYMVNVFDTDGNRLLVEKMIKQ
jgi:hypothetical protein